MDVQQTLATNRFPADDIVVLERGQGTCVVVHLHGATVLSWTCQGQEQLFLSSKSVFDNKKAIRGGIPLVFPNFGPWSLGPQHGFARIKRWTLTKPATKQDSGDVTATFLLEDDDETRGMWDNRFRVEYTLTVKETSLVSTMVIHNTGKQSFDFTCLFHNYFRVANINSAHLVGLKGLQYVDKVRDSKEFAEGNEALAIDGNYDRVYKNSPDTVYIQSAQKKCVQLTAANLTDTVVWNPWEKKAKEMGDFDDNGWRYMLCVEAGRVSSPFTLAAGEKTECGQTFTVLSQ
ncbi:uncharacterized protein LOC143281891 [Babylonia areolata]|uniref:uncharacterized protein LOC143281891 n=1 Tax=Babylonia areolata TaxID=304850 RepID=UPI003FD006B7